MVAWRRGEAAPARVVGRSGNSQAEG